MKINLLLLQLVLLAAACKYENVKQVTPKMSAQLTSGNLDYRISSSISVSLVSVLDDSRCPEDVMCIWEGNAEVQFKFVDNQNEFKFTLNTNDKYGLVNARVIHGYRIQLINLTPYPNTKVVVNPADYKAELAIQKE